MTGYCVYLKKPFVPGAKEHILQAALGARWKNGKHISPEANSRFSEIDSDLIDTVNSIRVLLGAEGEYGPGADLKNIPDAEGRKFKVVSGGGISLSEPYVKVDQLPDGTTKFYAEMTDDKQAPWAASKIAKHVKQTKPDAEIGIEALSKAIRDQGNLTTSVPSPLHFQLKIGGLPALRAVTKSAFNLLAVSVPDLARLDCFDPVRAFILDGVGEMEDFIRWGKGEAIKEPKIGPVDHFLAVWSDGEGVWGYCQLYGVLIHPIKLCDEDVGERFAFSYLVDPLREAKPAENRTVLFQPSSLQHFDRSEMKPEPSIWAGVTTRMKAVLSVMKYRMMRREVERMVHEAFGPMDGKPITAEQSAKLSERIGAFLAEQISINHRRQHNKPHHEEG